MPCSEPLPINMHPNQPQHQSMPLLPHLILDVPPPAPAAADVPNLPAPAAAFPHSRLPPTSQPRRRCLRLMGDAFFLPPRSPLLPSSHS